MTCKEIQFALRISQTSTILLIQYIYTYDIKIFSSPKLSTLQLSCMQTFTAMGQGFGVHYQLAYHLIILNVKQVSHL